MKKSNVISAVILSSVLASCGGPTEPEEGPPPVPPAASFVIDLSDFQSSPAQAGSADAVRPPGLIWGGAALTVGVWNVVLAVTLATPVAAFVTAVNQTPQWDDGRWVWRYNFAASPTASLVARLEATPRGEGHDWNMYITGQTFQSFNWFSGYSERDGSGGSWSLVTSPDDPMPFLNIDWTYDAASNATTIMYTNAIPGHAENGGFVSFGNRMVDGYDRWYQVYGASADNTTDIQWQSSTKDGRVRDPQRFGDTDWRCWDTTLDDVACPA